MDLNAAMFLSLREQVYLHRMELAALLKIF